MAIPEPRVGQLHGLDVLRAVASLAVFYVHLAIWFRHHGGPTGVTTWLERWVVQPAHLNQDFGFLGFAVFFLISGFVISAVAVRESAGEFAVKRIVRIVPPLAVAVLLAWVLVMAGHHRVPGAHPEVGLRDLVMNLTLANFFVPGNAMLVGVAWTLVIQLAIYLLVWVLLPLYRREPWLVIGIEITVCSVVLSVVRNFEGLAVSTLANIGAFGSAVILGQVVWAVWSRRLARWAGVGLGLACWIVFLWGDATGYGRYDDSYPLTLCLALLLLITVLLAEDRIRPSRVVTWLASRSYGTYLLHQAVAFSVLAATQSWNRWLAAVLAIGCTFVAVEILHRIVERPTHRLAPALVARMRRGGFRDDPPATFREPARTGMLR